MRDKVWVANSGGVIIAVRWSRIAALRAVLKYERTRQEMVKGNHELAERSLHGGIANFVYKHNQRGYTSRYTHTIDQHCIE